MPGSKDFPRALYGDPTGHLHKLYLNFDENVAPVIVYLDFCKAFHSVNHSCLLFQIASFRFDRDFVTLRTRAKFENSLFDVLHVSSEVPQENVLGPILC